MKKSQEDSSFLQDEQPVQEQEIQKQQNQFKALFIKNVILQSKQKCTNICQIITPIICLIFTYMMKSVAQENMTFAKTFDNNPYPYKFNDFYQFDQINQGISRSKIQYYLYECPQQCDQQFLGVNQNNTRSGMLGNISMDTSNVRFFPDPYHNQTLFEIQNMPFFRKAPDTINQQLFKRLQVIGTESFDIFKNHNGKQYIPDGSIKFHKLNNQNLEAQLKVDDCRDLEYHRNNGISRIEQIKTIAAEGIIAPVKQFTTPYGLLHIMHMTASSYIRSLTNQVVAAGYIFMPSVNQNSFVDTMINSVSGLIFPLGLSLLFPVFLYSIVLEKQERLIQMMKMNGLKIRYYWLTFFVFNFLLCLVTNLIFFLLGAFVLSTPFFVNTSPLLLLLVALGWSLSQIGMAAFFQTFLNKSRSANIIGYLVSIWTTMIGATLNMGVYQYPSAFPIGLQMFPPFAFIRLFYLMMMQCSNGDCFFDIGHINQQMKNCIVFLYLGFIFFFLLGAYLFEIIPQQFGVKRSPLFPFTSLIKLCKKKSEIQINTTEDPQLRDYISQHEQDQFSKKQRQKIINFSSSQNQDQIKNEYPLIINNMRKLYKKEGIDGMYAAVRSFNLAISKRQTFGLLGPNGAGKTTLISMITGMYQPNNGNAWIGGYDIRSNIQKAQLQMGVCPQFDLVWPLMSVSQHLYFYARLKGIPESKIKARVEASIKEVKLQKFADFAAKQLSGGMKRRLSVAISLVGDPKIVFLDQPSTGLDPENRRQLWSVLSECQTKRALFITTHMMQQADTLCNRIGIITNGVLRTVQTPIKLKKAYGDGYDVVINTIRQQKQLISRQSLHLGIQQQQWFNEQQKMRNSIGSFVQQQAHKNTYLTHTNHKIVQFMKNQFPGTYLLKHFNGYLIFKVPATLKISVLFETMNKVEKQLGFSDIAITNSSLQDVFMNVVSKFDSEQKQFYPYNKEQPQDQQQQDDYNSPKNSPKNVALNHSKSSYSKNKSMQKQQPIAQKKSDNFESIMSKQRQSVLSENESPGPSPINKKIPQQQQRRHDFSESNSEEEERREFQDFGQDNKRIRKRQKKKQKQSQMSQSSDYF